MGHRVGLDALEKTSISSHCQKLNLYSLVMEEQNRMTEMKEGKEDGATYFSVINIPQFFNPV